MRHAWYFMRGLDLMRLEWERESVQQSTFMPEASSLYTAHNFR